jgi:hypothetical protein
MNGRVEEGISVPRTPKMIFEQYLIEPKTIYGVKRPQWLSAVQEEAVLNDQGDTWALPPPHATKYR